MIGWSIVLLFSILVLVFDGVWSYIALQGGYNYFRGGWISFAIYALAGFAVTRNGVSISGALAGGIVAAVEATFGAALANWIGVYGSIPKDRWLRSMPFLLLGQPLCGAVLGFSGANIASILNLYS